MGDLDPGQEISAVSHSSSRVTLDWGKQQGDPSLGDPGLGAGGQQQLLQPLAQAEGLEGGTGGGHSQVQYYKSRLTAVVEMPSYQTS